MRFETIFRRLFDAAFVAYNQPGNDVAKTVAKAMQQAREGIREEIIPSVSLDLQFSEVIEGADGPIVTAYLFRKPITSFRFFQGLDAAALIRLKSNQRVMVTRGNLLGAPAQEHFEVTFSEGASQVTGGARIVPPFMLGDLSATDQSLHYMISRAVLGDHLELRQIAEQSFPPVNAARGTLCCEWTTDGEMWHALLRQQAA